MRATWRRGALVHKGPAACCRQPAPCRAALCRRLGRTCAEPVAVDPHSGTSREPSSLRGGCPGSWLRVGFLFLSIVKSSLVCVKDVSTVA